MNFWDSIKSTLNKYVEFTGSASRLEFWYWILFITMLSLVSMVIDYSINPTTYWDSNNYAESPAYLILIIFTILPGLSLSVRRLRDINKTWIWAVLILFAEMFLLFYPTEELFVSDNLIMVDYITTLSIIIYLFSFYWLGFKKSK